MDFCPECKSLILPTKKDGKTVIACKKCGYCRDFDSEDSKKFTIQETVTHSPKGKIVVIEENIDILPKTREECPKCKNMDAYWWEIQTRSSDEPSTKFFRCTKCNHTWREY